MAGARVGADTAGGPFRTPVSRRVALKYAAGGAVAGGVLARAELGHETLRRLSLQLIATSADPSFTATALRREDMLSLDFAFYNLRLIVPNPGLLAELLDFLLGTPPPQAYLQRLDPSKDAFIVAQLQGQSIGEEAFQETDPLVAPGGRPPGTVQAILADRSRVALLVPRSTKTIPYRLDQLLDWSALTLSVAPTAMTTAPTAKPAPAAPAATETAIEAPWRLVLSPNEKAGFAHATKPVSSPTGRTEMWHTRLAMTDGAGRPDELNPTNPRIRAIWTPDRDHPVNPFPVMSLSPSDRRQIVTLSSDYGSAGTVADPTADRTIEARQLMLSPLGAWLNTHGAWDPTGLLTVEDWQDRSTMAREHYVRVQYKGFLFPFGHRASLVKVTERKFVGGVAYLFQRFFIIVRDRVRTYADTDPLLTNSGRAGPFTSIEVTTLVTPNLNVGAPGQPVLAVNADVPMAGGTPPPQPDTAGLPANNSAFWVALLSPPSPVLQFTFVMTDHDIGRQEFTAPGLFVFANVAFGQGTAPRYTDRLIKYYNTTVPVTDDRRTRDFKGQKVAFAPPTSAKPGQTALDTYSLTFQAIPTTTSTGLEAAGQPAFYPAMEEAKVRIAAAEALSGGKDLGGQAITYNRIYLTDGYAIGTNAGEVFADLKTAVMLTFPTDKAGGLAVPNNTIVALSRVTGTVGGSVAAVQGATPSFDPKAFFGDLTALLIGAIDLVKVIVGGDVGKAPKLDKQEVFPDNDRDQPSTGVAFNLDWTAKLKADPIPIFVPEPDAELILKGVVTLTQDAQSGMTYKIDGQLSKFKLHLLKKGSPAELLIFPFEKLEFKASSGAKTSLDIELGTPTFAGPLKFINTLEQFLSSLSGGAGLEIKVGLDEIEVDVTLALPKITVGVLSIENLKFGAGLAIPFNNDPLVIKFFFCTRDDPALLTVYIFQGGFFFGLGVTVKNLKIVEGEITFGAGLSMDIGVASGQVSARAGIYFKVEQVDDGTKSVPPNEIEQTTLTGFFRLFGELNVLQIIDISLELYLELTYQTGLPGHPATLKGSATLTVKVEILFFSASVSIHAEKTFAGGSDPRFADAISPADWALYTGAFAAA